ncbi:MAG: glycosyltransferase family A protein [Actinomycetes bacterium]
MATAPAISVVIPVLDGATTLGIQLAALLEQRCPEPFEVVVADNGSSDATVAVAEAFADPRLRVVDASALPRNASAAKNAGVGAARAPLLAFCDADDQVADGWLAAVLGALHDHPVVSVTCEHRRLNPQLSDRSCPATVVERWFRGVPVFSGGAFGVRRDHYESVGGFAEHRTGAVDYEFALRHYRRFRVAPVPSGATVHVRLRTDPWLAFRSSRALHASLVDLAREYADLIEPEPWSPASEWRSWVRLARAMSWWRSPDLRIQWAWLAAERVGGLARLGRPERDPR